MERRHGLHVQYQQEKIELWQPHWSLERRGNRDKSRTRNLRFLRGKSFQRFIFHFIHYINIYIYIHFIFIYSFFSSFKNRSARLVSPRLKTYRQGLFLLRSKTDRKLVSPHLKRSKTNQQGLFLPVQRPIDKACFFFVQRPTSKAYFPLI